MDHRSLIKQDCWNPPLIKDYLRRPPPPLPNSWILGPKFFSPSANFPIFFSPSAKCSEILNPFAPKAQAQYPFRAEGAISLPSSNGALTLRKWFIVKLLERFFFAEPNFFISCSKPAKTRIRTVWIIYWFLHLFWNQMNNFEWKKNDDFQLHNFWYKFGINLVYISGVPPFIPPLLVYTPPCFATLLAR